MKYFAVSCSLFLQKPYFINMSELIEAIRYNISQREIFVVLVTNMKPYFYLFSAVNITISGDAFLYIYLYKSMLKEFWNVPNSGSSNIAKWSYFSVARKRKIDRRIIQQSTPNTLLNIEPIHTFDIKKRKTITIINCRDIIEMIAK